MSAHQKGKFATLPPLAYLHECYSIDSSCGSGLRWKNRPLSHFVNAHGMNIMNARFAGQPAGYRANITKRSSGEPPRYYWTVRLRTSGKDVERNGQLMLSHRVVYYMHTGRDPVDSIVDHRDGNTENNSPDNLRLATFSQNLFNAQRRPRQHAKGVTYDKRRSRYAARVSLSLGSYSTEKEAALAYQAAAEILHKEFALHLSRPQHSIPESGSPLDL